MTQIPLIGAHISIAGGLHMALIAGKEIGATTIQIFTANQRSWVSKAVSEKEVSLFRQTMKETGLSHIMSHGSYLINLGSPRQDVREKSIVAFRKEIERCLSLGITYLNFHPGAALDSPVKESLEKVIEAIVSMKDLFSKQTHLTLLIENMAGQGSVLGSTFEQLAYLIERTKGSVPIGICLDTCHAFAAGYEMRSRDGLKATLEHFDRTIGLHYLKAMHINDSVYELGSHKDRHACLGEGLIRKGGFSAIMEQPSLASIPKYLETPGGPEVWKEEIAWLRRQIP